MDQPPAQSYNDTDTARYCRQILRTAPNRLLANKTALTNFTSPDTGMATNLYTFMGQRIVATYQILQCQNLINHADPISVTTNAQGVTTSVSINTQALAKILQAIAPEKSDDDAADNASHSRQFSE